MKKTIFLIVIVLIVIGIIGLVYWFFFNSPNKELEEITEEEISSEESIKNLFAEKYSKDLSEILITIDKEENDHFSGIVVFGDGGPGEAGGFLAVKIDDVWELVYDGNGFIPCLTIEPYDFSVDMVEECFDEETQVMIDRTEQ